MVEGKIEIYLSHKEPNKNLLWLRPYLNKDGYELLYFGVNGWTPLCASNTCTSDNCKEAMDWCGEKANQNKDCSCNK